MPTCLGTHWSAGRMLHEAVNAIRQNLLPHTPHAVRARAAVKVYSNNLFDGDILSAEAAAAPYAAPQPPSPSKIPSVSSQKFQQQRAMAAQVSPALPLYVLLLLVHHQPCSCQVLAEIACFLLVLASI